MTLDTQDRTISLPFQAPTPRPGVFDAVFVVNGVRFKAMSEVWPEHLKDECPHPTFPLPHVLGERLVCAWYMVNEHGEISYPEPDSGSGSGVG